MYLIRARPTRGETNDKISIKTAECHTPSQNVRAQQSRSGALSGTAAKLLRHVLISPYESKDGCAPTARTAAEQGSFLACLVMHRSYSVPRDSPRCAPSLRTTQLMRITQCVLFDLTNMKHTAAACGTADARSNPEAPRAHTQ